MDIEKEISDFEKANKNCAIAYGGDGTLLDIARKSNFKKAIFPVRNYGLCQEHEHALESLLGKETQIKQFKQTIHPLLSVSCNGILDVAASEIAIKSSDQTSCIRCNLAVNGKLYMENVICDGIIFATALGSHGYFKSVTRTIFKSGIGVGFICPTYGINNLVLNLTDKVAVKLVRQATITISADKACHCGITLEEGSEIEVSQDPTQNLSLFGYDIFCCPKCRKSRNSTIINDQYLG